MTNALRKIFIVVAGGNLAAEKHFEDTIQRKRTLSEIRSFLPEGEAKNLEMIYHNSPFIVWGAVPGKMNDLRWEEMEPGDQVLIYNKGRIRYFGEIAAKAKNKELAKYFWHETEPGETWELVYFIVNEHLVDVPLTKLNPLFGYSEKYTPQGLTRINEEAVQSFVLRFGDLLGVLKALESGVELVQIPPPTAPIQVPSDEEIEKLPTEHTEIQWRLIRLGMKAKCDVWVPPADQGKEYENHVFRDYCLKEFHESLDVPRTIENVDVVWKFGPYSVQSAFEIENSTSVYSGILRLSDVRVLNPNSNYPLFIAAPKERRHKVFEELERPTFSGTCLRLNEVIRYLSYDSIRELDRESSELEKIDLNRLIEASEKPFSPSGRP